MIQHPSCNLMYIGFLAFRSLQFHDDHGISWASQPQPEEIELTTSLEEIEVSLVQAIAGCHCVTRWIYGLCTHTVN